jgi:hypothetical protein
VSCSDLVSGEQTLALFGQQADGNRVPRRRAQRPPPGRRSAPEAAMTQVVFSVLLPSAALRHLRIE